MEVWDLILLRIWFPLIRKDGKYTYDNKIMDLNQWQDSADGLPRFGLRFDEKGYVVSFWDANVM